MVESFVMAYMENMALEVTETVVVAHQFSMGMVTVLSQTGNK